MIIIKWAPEKRWDKTILRYTVVVLLCVFGHHNVAFGQIGPEDQEVLEVGEVNIIGATHTDPNALKVVSGLKTGARLNIPDDIQEAFHSLWDLNLFSDIRIVERNRIDNIVFIDI